MKRHKPFLLSFPSKIPPIYKRERHSDVKRKIQCLATREEGEKKEKQQVPYCSAVTTHLYNGGALSNQTIPIQMLACSKGISILFAHDYNLHH